MLPGSMGTKGAILLVALVVAGWLLSGFYRVEPDEQGVVLRFGRFVQLTQPGLNYHLPYPIETVLTPKVTRVNRIDIGMRLAEDTRRNATVLRDVPRRA